MDWQSLLVAVVVALSAASLLRKFWVRQPREQGGCSNCSACSSDADKACASSAGADFAPIEFHTGKPKSS